MNNYKALLKPSSLAFLAIFSGPLVFAADSPPTGIQVVPLDTNTEAQIEDLQDQNQLDLEFRTPGIEAELAFNKINEIWLEEFGELYHVEYSLIMAESLGADQYTFRLVDERHPGVINEIPFTLFDSMLIETNSDGLIPEISAVKTYAFTGTLNTSSSNSLNLGGELTESSVEFLPGNPRILMSFQPRFTGESLVELHQQVVRHLNSLRPMVTPMAMYGPCIDAANAASL